MPFTPQQTMRYAFTLARVRLMSPQDPFAMPRKAAELGLTANCDQDAIVRETMYQVVNLAATLATTAAENEAKGRTAVEVLDELSALFEMQNSMTPLGSLPDRSDGKPGE